MDVNICKQYIEILKEELVPALGCTEPISIAYGASKSVQVLGEFPKKIIVHSSGNIIKNAKGVIVPNTGSLKGIKASAIIGAVGGDADRELEVLSGITPEHIDTTKKLLEENFCEVKVLETKASLHFIVEVFGEKDKASVEIIHTHTNVVKVMKNDEIVESNDYNDNDFNNPLTDRSILNIKDILQFSNTIDIKSVQPYIQRQLEFNKAIAEEGLKNDYGINIGRMLQNRLGDFDNLIKGYTAAGSDARMGGSAMPVVTNSGSGNQGITISNSVYMFAKLKGYNEEKLYRALILANLVAIHIKTGISRLSSFCGAVVAGCGAAAAFTYMEDGSLESIEMTIKNIISNASGIICDGAKESCPAKIATSIDAALQAHYLAMDDKVVGHGCGIIDHDTESTIHNVGIVGREGMRETDAVILDIMSKI
ncbi:MAG: L-serine ammonia-lyase, iron-sulfur-dependent, subunit alpha [Clostridia bacterium]|nr:L-serine ammonia-lyase, iron-sulfur-dependent, subunit alpha [Clostridia bacterium]